MSHSRTLVMLGEILPVVGTIGLLGLWFYQQVGLESRSNELRKLASAQGVFQTYQSHNAVFNALKEILPANEAAEKRLRMLQDYNYESGLHAIEEALPAHSKTDIPAAPGGYGSPEDIDARMQKTQQRLELLQDRLHKREASLAKEADAAKDRYLWSYITLSFVSVLGAIFKILVKFSSADQSAIPQPKRSTA